MSLCFYNTGFFQWGSKRTERIRKQPFSSTEEGLVLAWPALEAEEWRIACRTLQGDRAEELFGGLMWEGEETWGKENQEPQTMPRLLPP